MLADIEARGITGILNLGDVVGKGPRGSEAVKLARETCEVTVRGNWDAFIARDAVQPFENGQWTRDELSPEDLAWLGALPSTFELVISGRRIRLFHASQTSEFARVRFRHTQDEFRGMFTNTKFTGDFRAGGAEDGATPDVVGYGDIHGAYLRVGDSLTLFNPGAVGNHLAAPSAPYAILEGVTDSLVPASFSVNFVRMPYDIDAEISVARELGMPDHDRLSAGVGQGSFGRVVGVGPPGRAAEGGVQAAERLLGGAVAAGGASRRGRDQAGFTQDSQVLGDRRLGDGEGGGDLPCGQLVRHLANLAWTETSRQAAAVFREDRWARQASGRRSTPSARHWPPTSAHSARASGPGHRCAADGQCVTWSLT